MKNYASSGTYNAYREYVYHYDEIADQIYVTFSDGRFFYHLELDEYRYQACGEHICNRDHYKANYSFFNNSHFSLCYEIAGYKKDYIIESDFIAFR